MKRIFVALVLITFSTVPNYGAVTPFSLTDRSGKEISLQDLLGKYWVANFIFTRCQGPCPLLTQNMKVLQKELPQNVSIVTFTVDPAYDSPKVLSQYAQEFSIGKEGWYFLTGTKENVYKLIRNGFKIGVSENPQGASITEQFIHSTYFVLVDPHGNIVGYFDGNEPNTLKLIPLNIRKDAVQKKAPWVLQLPSVNAILNLSCAFLLVSGFQFIRARKVTLHKFCMILALCVSSLFLASYLTYHFYLGSVPFLGEGWTRSFYFITLITHTFGAVLVPPLAFITLYFAWKGNFIKHKNIARWTFPIWLYVSISGVMVYTMLYWL